MRHFFRHFPNSYESCSLTGFGHIEREILTKQFSATIISIKHRNLWLTFSTEPCNLCIYIYTHPKFFTPDKRSAFFLFWLGWKLDASRFWLKILNLDFFQSSFRALCKESWKTQLLGRKNSGVLFFRILKFDLLGHENIADMQDFEQNLWIFWQPFLNMSLHIWRLFKKNTLQLDKIFDARHLCYFWHHKNFCILVQHWCNPVF